MKRTPQDRVDEHNALAKALNSVGANQFMHGGGMKALPDHNPAVNLNLSGLQFRHYPGDSKGFNHRLIAKNEEGKNLGHISWNGRSGRVEAIHVPNEYQGLGVATSLWERAHKLADMGHAPKPKHSNDRTIDGDAWSAKVGGKRPKIDRRRAAQNEARKNAIKDFSK